MRDDEDERRRVALARRQAASVLGMCSTDCQACYDRAAGRVPEVVCLAEAARAARPPMSAATRVDLAQAARDLGLTGAAVHRLAPAVAAPGHR